MQLYEVWKIKEPEGSETIWNIHYDASRSGKQIVVSNETHNCFVGEFYLYEWRNRLEAAVYYYMRKSIVSTQKCEPGSDYPITPGPSSEEWFKSEAYQIHLKRIGK